MIRVILYLILVGVIAYGVAFLADRPGDVVVTWQGLRIETSLLVLGAAVHRGNDRLKFDHRPYSRHCALAHRAGAATAQSPRHAGL